MPIAQDMVKRRRDIAQSELDRAERILAEQLRAQQEQNRAGGVQGGFGNDRDIALARETREAAGGIEKEYQSEIKVLNEIDRQKEADKAELEKAKKWKNWLTFGGMAAGAALAPITGGTSLTAIGMGAGLGAQAGGLTAGVLGYDDFAAQDVSSLLSGLGEYNKYVGYHKRTGQWPGQEVY